jgi:hypothetical protein
VTWRSWPHTRVLVHAQTCTFVSIRLIIFRAYNLINEVSGSKVSVIPSIVSWMSFKDLTLAFVCNAFCNRRNLAERYGSFFSKLAANKLSRVFSCVPLGYGVLGRPVICKILFILLYRIGGSCIYCSIAQSLKFVRMYHQCMHACRKPPSIQR